MSTIIDELVVILGAEVSPQAQARLDKFEGKLQAINRVAKGVIAGLSGMALGLVYFVHRASEGAAQMEKFHRLTGLSVRDLQGWRMAVEQAGGEAGDFDEAFRSMTIGINSFMPGRYNEGLFRLLGPEGLRNLESAEDAFFAINRAFQGMSSQTQLQWAADLGLSDSMLLLLQKTPDELQRYVAEKKRDAEVTAKQAEAALKYENQWKKVRAQLQLFGMQVGVQLAPKFMELLKRFEKWYRLNKDWIALRLKDVVLGFADGIGRLAGMAERLLQVVMPGLRSVSELVKSREGIASLVETLGKLALGLGGLVLGSSVIGGLMKLGGLFVAGGLFSTGGVVMLGLAALAAVGLELYTNWDGVARAFESVSNSLAGFGELTWGDFLSTLGPQPELPKPEYRQGYWSALKEGLGFGEGPSAGPTTVNQTFNVQGSMDGTAAGVAMNRAAHWYLYAAQGF